MLELFFGLALARQVPDNVVIRHAKRPTDVVEMMTAKCGSNNFGIQIRHGNKGGTLSLVVDNRHVPHQETEKVLAALRPGYFMYEPKIKECFWDRAGARFSILTGGPADHTLVRLSFEVSPERHVSAVREEL